MKDKYFRILKFLFPDYSDSHIWGLIKHYYDKNNLHGKESDGENDVLHSVSQQRELLLAFAKHVEKAGYDGSCLTYEQELDEFLKANNCGVERMKRCD